MSDLPSGWEWTTIDRLFAPLDDGRTIHQGWSPRCDKAPSPSVAEWGVLKTTAIQAGEFRPEHNKRLPDALEPRPQIEVDDGDLLLTCAGPRARCGVACLVRSTRRRLMMSGKMYRFRVSDEHVDPRYIEAYLQTAQVWLALDRMKTGGSDSGLNLTQARFRTLQVPLAPRSEQERIVAAIEEHLSRLDTAEKSLRHCTARSMVLRQRVIDHALEGPAVRLGNHFREPLRNGLSARASATGATRVVTLTAVTRNVFTEEHTKVIEPPARSIDDLWMQPGDIFVQRSNTPDLVGTAAMYRGPDSWAIFPDLLIRVRPDDHIDPAYLELALCSTRVRRYFQQAAQGIAGSMPKISQPTVEDAEIPLPDRPRQRAIVEQAERRLEAIDGLERNANLGGARSSTLRRSILAAAFSGRLVPQDPEDEPASVLLERIAAERTTATPKRRKRTIASS